MCAHQTAGPLAHFLCRRIGHASRGRQRSIECLVDGDIVDEEDRVDEIGLSPTLASARSIMLFCTEDLLDPRSPRRMSGDSKDILQSWVSRAMAPVAATAHLRKIPPPSLLHDSRVERGNDQCTSSRLTTEINVHHELLVLEEPVYVAARAGKVSCGLAPVGRSVQRGACRRAASHTR